MKIKLTLSELHQIFDALDITDEFIFNNELMERDDEEAFTSAYNKIAYAIQTYNE